MSLNRITIMGRMTKDPELRRTNSGKAVASFTLAVGRDFEKGKTDFIECVAWGSSAEFVAKHLAKGRMVVASGRLQIRDWTDKDGNKRKNAEIITDSVYFGDSKPSNTEQHFAEIEDDDSDLPF
jgi:single-strand DNA-binding protein